jgi:hypothetical protein
MTNQMRNDTMQQTSNAVVDAQAWEAVDNVQGTTSTAMEDTLHCDQDLNNRNQDEHDETDAQHADDPMDETINAARNASRPDDHRIEQMELSTESQRLDVSAASPLWLSCTWTPFSTLFHLLLPVWTIFPLTTNLSC